VRILIYGINYYPELIGIGKYSGDMSEWLTEKGHQIRVITAPPYYPEWQIHQQYRNRYYKEKTTSGIQIWRCPLYVPNKPNTLTRLLHLFSFALSSLPIVFLQWRWKPQLIITIEPTLLITPTSLLFAKCCGAKTLLHIQDYELDTLLKLNTNYPKELISIAKKIERYLMQKFDSISTLSPSMLQLAKKKLPFFKSIWLFPNWVDTGFIRPQYQVNYFRQQWQIELHTKVILYSGNMGKKQGLELIIQAADYFRPYPDILFLMVGTGVIESELKIYADQLQLTNIRFYPLQSYQYLPALMTVADIHLVLQKKGVADTVLPSKLTTIFAAGGTAIISAETNTALDLLCKQFPKIAYCIEPESLKALIDQLQFLLTTINPNNRQYNFIARQYAEYYLDRKTILNDFTEQLNQQFNH
jgi:colanic acid biosynthesis glycosyl transferase WcaI